MEFSVKNANHERVLIALERLIKQKRGTVCNCARCVNDITALALNLLPPHYYVDSHGDEERGSPWVMIETAVGEAMDRIAEKPNPACIRIPSVVPSVVSRHA